MINHYYSIWSHVIIHHSIKFLPVINPVTFTMMWYLEFILSTQSSHVLVLCNHFIANIMSQAVGHHGYACDLTYLASTDNFSKRNASNVHTPLYVLQQVSSQQSSCGDEFLYKLVWYSFFFNVILCEIKIYSNENDTYK